MKRCFYAVVVGLLLALAATSTATASGLPTVGYQPTSTESQPRGGDHGDSSSQEQDIDQDADLDNDTDQKNEAKHVGSSNGGIELLVPEWDRLDLLERPRRAAATAATRRTRT